MVWSELLKLELQGTIQLLILRKKCGSEIDKARIKKSAKM